MPRAHRPRAADRVTGPDKTSLIEGLHDELGDGGMSRQVRHRVTAIVVGGFLLGAAVVSTGTANAEQVEGGGRQVVFAGGGMLGLSCESTPSVGSMTVPAESTVRVVNRTGRHANLMLNGDSKGSIPDDGSTEVVFRRGTTAVTLNPNCAVADRATPVLVTATPSPSATPDPTPVPPTGGTDGATSTPPGPTSPATSSGGASAPGSGPATTPPQRPSRPGPATAPAGKSPDTVIVTRGRGNQAMPQGGAVSRSRTRTTTGTTGANVPAFSGMPPGEDKKVLAGVPTVDLSSTATQATAAQPAGPATQMAAAEPVAAMEPMADSKPLGLLTVIACICVVGVATGAIRAIVSQRASRTNMA
ncbi:hypothetical protein COUCH_01180 [Couchioplanes caeruleus]|uniref:hypothetical protein n=1 Tax=Couchioplanes caeruleus TaxID=56438 RepID=UPI0020C0FF55|nr:hypothetical protein [Couchioplanes caeruleus]UQU65004.1 hypothetical protein COUCH_01180 [Couchioplanes caeruleus]